MPLGYDTRIGDTTFTLSGGQQQLVGLARAIYQQPALLILDEPNSHLDEHGEANLLTTLSRLRDQGKTIVVVSHRAGILKIADRLLIMKDGEVAHLGPRDAVIAELNNSRLMPETQAA
jgi:ATP-binding cassette subfamily C exporter for protease/lipase